MNVTEAIVLAGGSGTRLHNTVPGVPKCLAPVNGKPFLHYLIVHLQNQGIKTFIFALGVGAEMVMNYLESSWPQLQKKYSTETMPLGTGGAIFKALSLATTEQLVVTNGDSIFKGSLQTATDLHVKLDASCTILLVSLEDAGRYGTVELGNEGLVKSFHEKQAAKNGLVNAGTYILEKKRFMEQDWPVSFSFEKDYLEELAGNCRIAGSAQEGYFIDIGLPSDYFRAQTEWIYF